MNFNFDINSIAQWLPIALLLLTIADRLGIKTPILTPLLKALAAALGKPVAPSPPAPVEPADDADKKLRDVIRDEIKKLLGRGDPQMREITIDKEAFLRP